MDNQNLNLPKAKQTVLGLYITAKDAYKKWLDDPDLIKIIDVRTPEELLFVGHAPIAWKIPLAIQNYTWDTEKNKYSMALIPDFVSRVQQVVKPNDTIMVMCRSGGRSAIAVNLLAQAGFRQVYQIIDGMEGDKVQEEDSVYLGQRMKNGWKNSGCPWSYDLTPERTVFPNTNANHE